MGRDYVSITDNADPMDVVVLKRARRVKGSRTVCTQPVFAKGASATDNSLIGTATVLPAVLAWLGDRVEKGRLPFLHRRTAGPSPFWSWIVERVMRRPWAAIVVAGGLLLLLAVPALRMNIAVTSVDDLPQNLAVIQTYNRLREAFPKEGVTVDVVVKAH